jgi:hypothetical protein
MKDECIFLTLLLDDISMQLTAVFLFLFKTDRQEVLELLLFSLI